MCIHDYTAHMNAQKNAGLRLRVERELRTEFNDVCRANGRPSSDVLREYMREYVNRHRAAVQPDLFRLEMNGIRSA